MVNPENLDTGAATILVQNFPEQLDQVKLHVQWWEKYCLCPPDGFQETLKFVGHQFLPQMQIVLPVILISVPTISHAKRAWLLGEPTLLIERNNLQ